jgi:hypothetical protein
MISNQSSTLFSEEALAGVTWVGKIQEEAGD